MIVILTALDLEGAAVRAHLAGLKSHHHSAGTIFEVGHLTARPECTVALSVIGMGAVNAAAITERSITEFQPSAMVFVGVAGALREWIALGDVVVATRVYAYQGGRVDDDEFLARPRAWDTSHRLVQLAQHINRSKAWPTPAGGSVTVHFEPIAAGDVVLNSTTATEAQHLRSHYNDAAVVEMESAGMALAGHLAESTPTIAIRGVSDRADGAKPDADRSGWQFVAANNAAAFAVGLAAAITEAQLTTPPAGNQAVTIPALPRQQSQPPRNQSEAAQNTPSRHETGETTVAVGRDQRIRGNVVIGGGSVTVDKRRNYRIGFSALAVIIVSTAITLVVNLTVDGQRPIGGVAVPNSGVTASSAAKPLATTAPTSLGGQVATLKAFDGTTYAYNDTTFYTLAGGQHGAQLTATTIASGKPIWSTTFPDTQAASGNAAASAGRPHLVTTNSSTVIAAPYIGMKPGTGTTPSQMYMGVLAADSSTGDTKWNSEKGQPPPNTTGRDLYLIGRGSTLALSWRTKLGAGLVSDTYATMALSATDGKTLWTNDDFQPLAIDEGVVAGFNTKNQPIGLAATDGHQLWALDEHLYNRSMNWVSPATLFLSGLDFTTQVSELVDTTNGSRKMEFRDNDTVYTSATDAGHGAIVLDAGSAAAAYDSTSFRRLWALPDPSSNRISPPITAVWHGAAYAIGTDGNVIMLDVTTGKDVPSKLPCPPTILVPGYALCAVRDGFVVHSMN